MLELIEPRFEEARRAVASVLSKRHYTAMVVLAGSSAVGLVFQFLETGLYFAEADHFALVFVPKLEAEASQALPEGDLVDGPQLGMLVHALLQPVVGDQMIQVMQVMDADVGGEPLQDLRQGVVRAALDAGLEVVPLARCIASRLPRTDAARRTAKRRWRRPGRRWANKSARISKSR